MGSGGMDWGQLIQQGLAIAKGKQNESNTPNKQQGVNLSDDTPWQQKAQGWAGMIRGQGGA